MRIAIIGFGVVGKSVLAFFTSQQGDKFANVTDVLVWDACPISTADEQMIVAAGARVVSRDCMTLGDVINFVDRAVVSPGVNLNRYKQHAHKFVCELDIFEQFFEKKTVGITGSLGKTTTTKLLGALAGKTHSVAVGGNIGLGMLDLVAQQKAIELAVLELSSFQLEFNKKYAPDIAIWTNCFANHLDRHETMQAYFEAKFNLIAHQTKDQWVLLSATLLEGEVGHLLLSRLPSIKSKICFVGTYNYSQISHVVPACPPEPHQGGGWAKAGIQQIYHPLEKFRTITVENGHIVTSEFCHGNRVDTSILCAQADLPAVTFIDNWLHVLAALQMLGIDVHVLVQELKNNREPFALANEHRCEFVRTVRGVDFYNDSKATVIQSTEAAVSRLAANNRPIILILGGLGKGVDRSPLLQTLKTTPSIKKMYCFGKECAVFASAATCYSTLEEVIADVAKIMVPGDQVLLSPSGTSYDLYKNYEERGRAFKKMVAQI